MQRVKYPLTEAAKEAAKYLVEAWNNALIEQEFVVRPDYPLEEQPGQFARRVRTLDTDFGKLSDDFECPSLNLLKELALFQLIDLNLKLVGKANKPTENYRILLLQELRNAVENDFAVSEFFLTTQAVGTIISGDNITFSAPLQSAASNFGDISQSISNTEFAEKLKEILGRDVVLQSNDSLSTAIQHLAQATSAERESKLGKVISELGRGLQHGANTYVVIQALYALAQFLAR